MKRSCISFYIFTILVCIGCSSSRKTVSLPPPEIPEIKSVHPISQNIWMAQNKPGERNTLIRIDSSGQIKIVASQLPAPEFSKNILSDSGIVITGTADLSQLLKWQKEQAALEHKSISTLLSGEALYRISEAYFNGLIDHRKFEELYDKVIAQAATLLEAEIELEEAKAETILAETEKARILLQKAQLELEMLKIEKGIYAEKSTVTDSTETKEE